MELSMNISELAKFRGGVSVDTISELTSASGVTIDGVLLKDGFVDSNQIAWREPTMFRNRIKNAAMLIDQRATAVTTTGQYTVDRWIFTKSNDGTESVAQSTDAPAGFTKSLKNTISVADVTLAAGQYSEISQKIEGLDLIDLAWGTASAKSVTVSFWVKSRKTGAHAASVQNGASNRIYPFEYTVNVADTWEFKTATIPGDTTGTWATDNTTGLRLFFHLALGSTYTGATAGAWNTSKPGISPVNVLDGTGAFLITGVQLEPGSIATPFEFRPYAVELANCQRYCYAFTTDVSNGFNVGVVNKNTTNVAAISITTPVVMRVSPTWGTTGTVNTRFMGSTDIIVTSSITNTILIGNIATFLATATGIANGAGVLNTYGGGTIILSAEL